MMRLYNLAVPLVVALSALRCADLTELEPAQDADKIGDVAVANVAGIRVLAQGDWPGGPGIRDDVTPLELTVTNGGDRPILLRYEHVVLEGAGGERFAAVPPFRIQGTAERYMMEHDYEQLTPSFAHRGFEVWGPYRGFYAGVVPEAHRENLDPSYYDSHFSYWRRVKVQLPTREMLEWALPEGALAPGGSVTGFLYFEHVPEAVGNVDLAIDVIDAQTNEKRGTIRIPFETD